MFLNIQIDLIILKTYHQQFTLTTKKSLHIIFKMNILKGASDDSMCANKTFSILERVTSMKVFNRLKLCGPFREIVF